LRLSFAAEHKLGSDPTIKRSDCISPDGVQYDIVVNSTVYRTVRLILNIGAESLRGQGTRVWEVNEVLPEGTIGANTLVLKDSWVDKDRKREEDILQSIRESYEGDGKKFCGNAHLLTCVEG
jgi:hypothetical protein